MSPPFAEVPCKRGYRLRLTVVGVAQTKIIATVLDFRKAPYFASHKGIAIGFLKAIGFRNKLKRTIFYFWRGDPSKNTTNGKP